MQFEFESEYLLCIEKELSVRWSTLVTPALGEAGGLGVQGQPWQYGEFKASLGHLRPIIPLLLATIQNIVR